MKVVFPVMGLFVEGSNETEGTDMVFSEALFRQILPHPSSKFLFQASFTTDADAVAASTRPTAAGNAAGAAVAAGAGRTAACTSGRLTRMPSRSARATPITRRTTGSPGMMRRKKAGELDGAVASGGGFVTGAGGWTVCMVETLTCRSVMSVTRDFGLSDRCK